MYCSNIEVAAKNIQGIWSKLCLDWQVYLLIERESLVSP